MHYLVKRIFDLNDTEKTKVINEVIAARVAMPNTTADKVMVSSMLDYTAEARERLKNWGKMQGMSSGYRSIDELTKGFVPGELIIVAGKTSYGKTTLAMNMSNRIALGGYRVLFVTLEMTHVELTSRFMFINGGETEDYLTVATNTLFQNNSNLDWKSINGLIANAKNQLMVDLVVIDHLHYFTRELENVSEDLGRITKELKKNAKDHMLPIILISHVRKTGQDRHGKDKPATMEDLRSSSYIAQDADIVLMVGRDEDSSDMYVKIEKNRNRGFDPKASIATLLFNQTKLTERYQ